MAWLFFALALVGVAGFLVAPYSEIWVYPRWDQDLGSNGWTLLGETWEVVVQPAGPLAVGLTASIAFNLLTTFSIICIIPTTLLL